jgi:hypothetical protein
MCMACAEVVGVVSLHIVLTKASAYEATGLAQTHTKMRFALSKPDSTVDFWLFGFCSTLKVASLEF